MVDPKLRAVQVTGTIIWHVQVAVQVTGTIIWHVQVAVQVTGTIIHIQSVWKRSL